jgi:hypothetical protein
VGACDSHTTQCSDQDTRAHTRTYNSHLTNERTNERNKKRWWRVGCMEKKHMPSTTTTMCDEHLNGVVEAVEQLPMALEEELRTVADQHFVPVVVEHHPIACCFVYCRSVVEHHPIACCFVYCRSVVEHRQTMCCFVHYPIEPRQVRGQELAWLVEVMAMTRSLPQRHYSSSPTNCFARRRATRRCADARSCESAVGMEHTLPSGRLAVLDWHMQPSTPCQPRPMGTSAPRCVRRDARRESTT